ncbi:hypothetical protein DFH08DRAFT_826061 [Mycena albidolilacea]|uniref:Uncharacterized protein n=1 Tax=Mycena albidolilacea TaxID=1033008 RepID=A0AAD7E8U1_9AGAR|nr:hypothetical protein DFH08DRAFT_826061 [Mycena albidolilacea]
MGLRNKRKNYITKAQTPGRKPEDSTKVEVRNQLADVSATILCLSAFGQIGPGRGWERKAKHQTGYGGVRGTYWHRIRRRARPSEGRTGQGNGIRQNPKTYTVRLYRSGVTQLGWSRDRFGVSSSRAGFDRVQGGEAIQKNGYHDYNSSRKLQNGFFNPKAERICVVAYATLSKLKPMKTDKRVKYGNILYNAPNRRMSLPTQSKRVARTAKETKTIIYQTKSETTVYPLEKPARNYRTAGSSKQREAEQKDPPLRSFRGREQYSDVGWRIH